MCGIPLKERALLEHRDLYLGEGTLVWLGGKSQLNEESRKSNLCEVDALAPSLVERGTCERRAKRCQVRRP